MLQKLHIQNYAIIDSLEINFQQGLNIITGETGAGKSILMGALSLILGDRADSSALLNREKKCVVEGFFATAKRKDITTFLKENDLDADAELVIRREIAATGKSRAFINDTPVNLEQLRSLTALLVDLHRQFDTLALGETQFQRSVLDALANHADVLNKYEAVFNEWQLAQKELAQLQLQKAQFSATYDYHSFLFKELEAAALQENELEAADAALKLMSNAEQIKAAVDKVAFALGNGDAPMVQQLKQLVNQLQNFQQYQPQLPVLTDRLRAAQIELDDIAGEIEQVADSIQYDPQRIEQLNERIATGYKLFKKHNVNSTAALLQLQQDLSEKLQAVLNIDDSIAAKEKETAALLEQATVLASTITANRQKQLKPLQEKVNALLVQVGMPNAQLKVTVEPLKVLNEFGADLVAFLFDANKSNRFEPIHKVASGGELSRLMLCIKSLVAQSLQLPTLIFDEIDTGISGEAAKQVGVIMKGMAKKLQVVAITHQPQIAGKADAHYFVYKEIKGEAVKTNIRLLTQEERITTIAKMLSGEKPTAAALENAREMVMN
ncbi:MAG: DNA repair protein RecN [Sphingobacteriales bacterium]|nr:MAG: DNA repair protein RecN [Sphingobacteriales bacterium]